MQLWLGHVPVCVTFARESYHNSANTKHYYALIATTASGARRSA